jgi:hypothetical protein
LPEDSKTESLKDASVAATMDESEITNVAEVAPMAEKQGIEEAEVMPSVSYADIVKNDPAVEDEPSAPIEHEDREAVEGAKTESPKARMSPEPDHHVVPETVTDDEED